MCNNIILTCMYMYMYIIICMCIVYMLECLTHSLYSQQQCNLYTQFLELFNSDNCIQTHRDSHLFDKHCLVWPLQYNIICYCNSTYYDIMIICCIVLINIVVCNIIIILLIVFIVKNWNYSINLDYCDCCAKLGSQ